MILIRFPSDEMKRWALAGLAGRFAFKSWGTGEMLVPEDALPFLAVQGIAFAVDEPPPLPPGSVPVHVTILARPAPEPGGPAMAAALAALAASGGPSGFGDPTEWQREARVDRPLPGRDE